MKKIFIVLLSSLLFSGCINITEEIFLEKNGSGKYTMTLDLEKAREMMDMLKSFAPDSTSSDNKDAGASMFDSLQTSFKGLEEVPGISNISREQKGNTFVVSFRFNDVRALNEAMKTRNQKAELKSDLYAYTPGNFAFTDTSMFGMGDAMKELEQGDSDSAQASMEMIKNLIGDMNYTTIYHLPGKVRNFTNKDAVLDADGKTLRLTVNLMDKGKVSTLHNKVSYQN